MSEFQHDQHLINELIAEVSERVASTGVMFIAPGSKLHDAIGDVMKTYAMQMIRRHDSTSSALGYTKPVDLKVTGADVSFMAPSDCTTRMRLQGLVYPRSCKLCKLGPCPYERRRK